MLFFLFWLLWPLLYALGTFGISTAFVANEAIIIHAINMFASCLLPLRGVYYIVLAKRSKTRLRLSMLSQTLVETALALTIIFLPSVSYPAFLVVMAAYFSFLFAVQSVNSVIYFRNRVFQSFIPSVCQAVLFLFLFVAVIALPDELRYRYVMGGAGFLLSTLGVAFVCDCLSVMLKNKRAAGIFRKISVTMPGFSGLGAPARLLNTLRNDSSGRIPDAEIIFSYGKNAQGMAGHCELCVDGKTFTYGNYDPGSRAILETTGNGIIFRAEKEKYIDFLLRTERTVVVYGLKLNREQRAYFRHTLSLFERSLKPWKKEAENTPPDEYIHRVISELGADVFRIDEGRFKTYFLPTINCVTLTGSLLRGTPAGNIVIPGVYTPGSYMDALHRLYLSGDGVVVSVNVYNPE